VLAVPADHPLADAGGPVDLSVLAGEDVLLLEEGHCLRDQALSVCRLAGAANAGASGPPAWRRCARWSPPACSRRAPVTLLPELARDEHLRGVRAAGARRPVADPLTHIGGVTGGTTGGTTGGGAQPMPDSARSGLR
jgi:hypothetical protein